MGELTTPNNKAASAGARLQPGEALWHYVPTHDADGRPVSDFMLLVPGFRKASEGNRALIVQRLEQVLTRFDQQVVFANLNLRLGILWVSVDAKPGLCGEIAAALQSSLPGAKVVGNYLRKTPSRLARLTKGIKGLLT